MKSKEDWRMAVAWFVGVSVACAGLVLLTGCAGDEFSLADVGVALDRQADTGVDAGSASAAPSSPLPASSAAPAGDAQADAVQARPGATSSGDGDALVEASVDVACVPKTRSVVCTPSPLDGLADGPLGACGVYEDGCGGTIDCGETCHVTSTFGLKCTSRTGQTTQTGAIKPLDGVCCRSRTDSVAPCVEGDGFGPCCPW